MKTQNVLLWLALAAVAVMLFKKQDGAQKSSGVKSPVAHVVEETLHQHEGEDNPIVHAFEEALAKETGAA